MKSFQLFAKTQLGREVKAILIDNVGEFRGLFHTYPISTGVLHRFTCSYTQQNGIVERKAEHIVEFGMTLLPLDMFLSSFRYIPLPLQYI